MNTLTAADIANSQTVEHALNEVRTPAELGSALSQILNLSAPSETSTVDLDDLGSDSIAVLGDGSVLCWGAEHLIDGESYRNLVVYGGAEDGTCVLQASTQAEIWQAAAVDED